MQSLRPFLALCLMLLAGCGTRRFYPLLALQSETDERARFELGAAALLPSGVVVAISETDSRTLYELRPRSAGLPPRGGEVFDLFEVTEPSLACPEEERAWRRCKDRDYRAHVALRPQAIAWRAGADGSVALPHHIEDLAAYPCAGSDCLPRVMGVTEFSSTGRITSFRADQVVRGRDETERVFVLERGSAGWREVSDPAVEVLRQRLSDWGRASCEGDFVVEGLAFDPTERVAYVGVNRCKGPAQTVLSFPIWVQEQGGAAHLEVVAEGLVDTDGSSLVGPAESLSSLDFAYGQVWATTSWDDFGYPEEPAWGARVSVVQDGRLRLVPLPGPLRDRGDALVVLPNREVPRQLVEDADVDGLFPYLRALLLFDNDQGARDSSRPDGTLLYGRTPAPDDFRHVQVLEVGEGPLGDPALGLNGFDFRWFFRDHRLGQLSVVADTASGEPGAWTTALGGLWQVRLGALGKASRSWPLVGKAMGHDRHAVELTDYAGVDELEFTSYRAVLSVVPWERSASQASIAQVLEQVRARSTDTWRLPEAAPEGAGLVLQGLTIDTSPRASGGICLAAMDVGVDWVDPDEREEIELRGALLGGLCNDFDMQKDEEHHGLTTDPSSGVRVTLYFAVVEGAEAQRGSLVVSQRDRPGRRDGQTGAVLRSSAATSDGPPPLAPYASESAPWRVGNHASKDNLACVRVDADSVELIERPHDRHAPEDELVEWQLHRKGSLPEAGAAAAGGSLSGFAFAFDLRGFDESLWPDAYADVTELTARNQNVYLYRYMLRAWPQGESTFLEGGASHGLHLKGLGKDNAMPTAMMVRADLTWWEELSAEPVRYGPAPSERPNHDPNLQPEDGFLRWAHTAPLAIDPETEEIPCLPR